jgi:biopolymer transport protein ExbD
MKRRRQNEGIEHIEVSLTPLIDTVLVLLIVFMAAGPIVMNSFKVLLPTGKMNEYRDNKNDLFLAVNQYNEILIDKKTKISEKDLLMTIKKNLKKTPHIAVVVFVDSSALCGFVFELIDKIKALGISYVYCKTKKQNT